MAKYKLERYDDYVNDSTILSEKKYLLIILETIFKMDTSYLHFVINDNVGLIKYIGYAELKQNFYYLKLRFNIASTYNHEQKYNFYISKEKIKELYTLFKLSDNKINLWDYIELDTGGSF